MPTPAQGHKEGQQLYNKRDIFKIIKYIAENLASTKQKNQLQEINFEPQRGKYKIINAYI